MKKSIRINTSSVVLMVLLLWTCSVNAERGDIISSGTERLFDHIAGLRPEVYLLPVRLAVVFVSIGILSWYWFLQSSKAGSRSDEQQWGSALIGLIAGISIPIQGLVPDGTTPKAWMFLVSCIISVVGPPIVSFFIVRTAGHQEKLIKFLYVVMAVLVVVTLLRKKEGS